VSVIGSNGSGKSTILNVVAGTYRPDEGSIQIAGTDVTRWPEHKRAKLIGRVFQDPFKGTCPSMTVAENLRMAELRGQRRGLRLGLNRRARLRYRDALASLGMRLEGRLDASMGTLSGGQRQAITLLMATLTRPELLLLDEHTAALDPKSADQVIQLSDDIVSRDRLTTLMVTHSMQQAAQMGDRLVMRHRGSVIHDFRGAEKQRLRANDLLNRFEEVRRAEQLDESAADMLRRLYV
jgi:putative ABC transport system ATP-binding protein